MTRQTSRLVLATSPFVRTTRTTHGIMIEVLLSLVPVVAFAAWLFGISALLVVVAALAGSVGIEWVFMGDRRAGGSLRDGTAVLTGVLVALTLPPGIPLWMAFLGGAIGTGLGKLVWGGLGQNAFNPALVGRAFLQASFPDATTTWHHPAGGFWSMIESNFAAPLIKGVVVNTETGATALGLAKFEHIVSEVGPLFFGNTGGSLGETSAVLLIVIGLWLALRRIFDWRLAVATVASTALFSSALFGLGLTPSHPPLLMVLSGGLLFGAVFMVTDPVTTPITARGAWIFGAGVGLLVVLIRCYGGLPEGVMFAILLMNAVTPLINRVTQPRRFGG